MRIIFLTLLISVLAINSDAQTTEKRIALVIGNSNYIGENSLKNPVNDANLMASTLIELGFTVIERNDVNRQQMTNAIADFWSKLGQYNVSLFYYAGHGVAVNGVNYLLPVDAQMADVSSVELDAISVSSIVAKFDKYPNSTNILILDACRNNPFKEKRGSDRGFKAINPSKGTLIAFAAADGEFAGDNPKGNNGLFTEKLVTQMKQQVMIEQVFKKTRSLVQMASNYEQNPMEWNMLTNDFYFVKPTDGAVNNKETTTTKLIIDEETLTGTLRITSYTDGTFYLDGISSGEFSKGKVYTLRNISAGKHHLEVGSWAQTVSVEANNVLDVKSIDLSGIAIGKKYAGGIIFYIDSTGMHGLVCSPTDQGKAKWGCSAEAEGTAVGTGNQNTINIIAGGCYKISAAKICTDLELNGYTDWFLPSKDELALMYTNLKAKGFGGFRNELYWSSSKYDRKYSTIAWYCNFENGKIATNNYSYLSIYVRAIRAF